MKIAYDATALLGNSGIETYSRELIRSMMDTFPENEYHLHTLRKRQQRLVEVFGQRSNAFYYSSFPHLLMLGAAARPVMELYHAYRWRPVAARVDIIHYTNPFMEFRIKNYAITIHDIIPLYNEKYVSKDINRRFSRIMPSIARDAGVIFVPTNFVRQELVKAFPKTEEKVQVVYEAAGSRFAPLERDDDVLSKYNIKPGSQYFLYVGRIEERKNIDRIIEAYSMLPASIRSEISLVLVANGKEVHINWLKGIVSGLGLEDNVIHLIGVPESDLVQLFSSSLGFVFPTLSEGFGLPVIEAMQCGSPVISSNISCIPEIASDAALLVNPYETAEIADAMKQFATNDSLRNNYREKGFKRALDFSWQKAAGMTLKGYESVLG